MSLHSLQRSYAWIMGPSRALNLVTTPERWPFLPGGVARRITQLIAFDTTGLGRAMRRLKLFGGLRDELLPRSAALRSLDWQARKAFWTFQWCMMVAFPGVAAPRSASAPGTADSSVVCA